MNIEINIDKRKVLELLAEGWEMVALTYQNPVLPQEDEGLLPEEQEQYFLWDVNEALRGVATPRPSVFKARGVYAGKEEQSFLIFATPAAARALSRVATRWGQESILFTLQGEGFLKYHDGRREHLGRFRWVGSEGAENPYAYTEVQGRSRFTFD